MVRRAWRPRPVYHSLYTIYGLQILAGRLPISSWWVGSMQCLSSGRISKDRGSARQAVQDVDDSTQSVLQDGLTGVVVDCDKRNIAYVLGMGATSLQRGIVVRPLQRHERFSVVCLELIEQAADVLKEGFITIASMLHKSEPTDQCKGKII